MLPGSMPGSLQGLKLKKTFTLRLLAREFARPADRLGLFASFLLRRLLISLTEFHLAEDAFALHLLLQRPERLIDIVITNQYLHVLHHLSVI